MKKIVTFSLILLLQILTPNVTCDTSFQNDFITAASGNKGGIVYDETIYLKMQSNNVLLYKSSSPGSSQAILSTSITFNSFVI